MQYLNNEDYKTDYNILLNVVLNNSYFFHPENILIGSYKFVAFIFFFILSAMSYCVQNVCLFNFLNVFFFIKGDIFY